MDRRAFLCSSPALAAGITKRSTQRVEAEATIFFAQPDGRSVLARFTAHALDAPAARLRVFGAGRRLLGTAGLLRAGNSLYGELWLSLERETVVTSELEAPGLRGVHRTTHRLRPAPRWTLHWLRLRDADALERELDRLPMIRNAIHAALLRHGGVTVNPLAAARSTGLVDHLDFLLQPQLGTRLETRFGVPMAPLGGLENLSAAWPTLPLVLAGHDLTGVLTPWDGGAPFRWWEGPDGSRALLAAVAPGGSSDTLEFGASVGAMAGRIGRWIADLGGRTTASGFPHAIVLDTGPDDNGTTKLNNVGEWNRRFAFPRLVVGASDALETWENLARASTPASFHTQRVSAMPRENDEFVSEARRLAAARSRRAMGLIEIAGRTLGTPPDSSVSDVLTALAANVDAAYPGALVFNSTPFRRTDVAVMPNGVRRVVTDVPPLGYAYVPEAEWRDAPAGRPTARGATVTTSTVHLEVDDRHGAIRSLQTYGDEWARQDADGLNAVTGSIVEGISRADLDGIGTRLVVDRWSPARGMVRTAITVYDALPFVDIENNAEAIGDRPMEYYFHWWADEPAVAWDIPAGSEERAGTIPHLAVLQWIRIASEERHVVLATPDAHHGAFLAPGALTSTAAPGLARYRLWPASFPPTAEAAWRAGSSIEPLVAVRSTGGGTRLPRYGPLFRIEPAGVLCLGFVPDERGALLYLLNVTPEAQLASVAHGALRFQAGRLADLAGRDRGDTAGQLADGVLVAVPRQGVATVRLEAVGLNG